jgi:hypothetical protein
LRPVEFLRAWEDRTWDTEIIEVPEQDDDPDNGVNFNQLSAAVIGDLLEWTDEVLLVPGNSKYDGLALFAVYNTEPEVP